jgi:hypothetical protein
MSISFQVNPGALTVAVSVDFVATVAPTQLYADSGLTEPLTSPVTVTTTTSFYVASAAAYSVSLMVGGTEVATASGAPITVGLQAGVVPVLSPVTSSAAPTPVTADVQALADSNVNIASPGGTFDSYAMETAGSDKVLLTAQSTASQNGVWVWNGATSPLMRATDFYTGLVLTTGKMVRVENGDVYNNLLWSLNASAASPVTVGTTAQTWADVTGR